MKKLALLGLLASIILVGCSGGRSLDGKWTATADKEMPPGTKIGATFSSGNHMALTLDIPQPLPTGATVQLHGDVTGTYTLDGGMMGMHADDVKFSGSGFPEALKTQLESSLKGMGDSVKEQLNKEGKTKMVWVDDNQFTLTGKSGKPETFTRVK